jgi:hypothetical protein
VKKVLQFGRGVGRGDHFAATRGKNGQIQAAPARLACGMMLDVGRAGGYQNHMTTELRHIRLSRRRLSV